MSSIATTVSALATQLRSVITDATVSIITERDANVIPPALIIDDAPEQQTPTNLPQTQFTETYTIIVVVPFSDQVSAQRQLREFLSTTGSYSVRAALMDDITLNGYVYGLEVGSPTKPGPISADEDDEVVYFGAAIPVMIDT